MITEEIKNKIKSNTFVIAGEEQMFSMLENNNEVKIKWGIDPSSEYMHIGHISCLNKIKQFLSEFSNVKVQVILGTATIYLHDPSSAKKRNIKGITREIFLQRADMIKKRIQMFLSEYSSRVSFHYNHEWLINNLDIKKVIAVSSKISFQDMSTKFKRTNIYVSQGIYPIFQAYDSFILQNDIEIGGSDQIYNILLAREQYKILECKKQVGFFLKLLTNISGEKMSKSSGKTLSFKNPLIFWRSVFALEDKTFLYYLECFNMSNTTTREDMALFFINSIFDISEQEEFCIKRKLWKKDILPDEMIKVEIKVNKNAINIIDVVCFLSSLSRSEVKRRIKAGAVKVNNSVCSSYEISFCNTAILSFGKMEKYLCNFSIV